MKISDIEVGKYYWIDNISNKWIIKITKVDGRKIWGPCITIEDKLPSYYGDRRWGTFEDRYSIKKVTQEQIDHLDACIAAGKYVEAPEKPKFEVGKWYEWHYSYETTIFYYLKCTKIINNNFYYKEFIHIGGRYGINEKERDYFINVHLGKEVTLQEIQQYLPEGHPDRIDTVPEYVECISALTDFTIGKIYNFSNLIDDDGDKRGEISSFPFFFITNVRPKAIFSYGHS